MTYHSVRIQFIFNEKANKFDKPDVRTTGGRYPFPMGIDDCVSAATSEDPPLRELQRRVEDLTAAFSLRLALGHNKYFPPLGGRLCA